MFAVLVNTGTVLLGSTLGLLLQKGISKRFSTAVMIALGLCSVYIGIRGALEGNNTLVAIISLAGGVLIGTALDLDGKLNRLGDLLSKKMKKADGKTGFTEGFVSASLLFCVGAMTTVGALQAGLTGDTTLLMTKATLDLFSSFMLAASLGVGVVFSAAFVLVFEGALVLLAGLLSPVLTDGAVAELTCVGSLMIVAIGLNLIGVTKIKTADFFPALVLAPLVYYLFQFLSTYIPALA